MESIYLDNAASTPLHPEVLEAMLPYLKDLQGNPSSVHAHGRKLRSAIEKSRKTIADLLGCAPGEIVFTSGGTEADNYAIKSCFSERKFQQIITSPLEHHAVLHPVELLKKQNPELTLTYLDCDEKGNLDMAQLEEALKDAPGKTFVSLMHGNNEIGTLNDLEAIGALCETFGAVFHTDAVQSIGHLHLCPESTKVHFIAASAHKFYGPKGVGFMYKSPKASQMPSLICGGGQERNQRAGTENVAAIVGMTKALEMMYENREANEAKLWGLKRRMKTGLLDRVPGVKFNGETEEGRSLPTVLNTAFPGTDEESLLLFNLDLAKISVSGGSACTSGSVSASHVLTALGCEPVRMANSVRFSFGLFNTPEEIDYALDKIESLVAQAAPTNTENRG